MNKKIIILTTFVFVVVLAGAVIFWQTSPGQNTGVQKGDGNGSAANNSLKTVEVFYLPHPPVAPIREKIKSILRKFPDYRLKEYSFYDDNNEQKIQEYDLLGHIPVAIFINGADSFTINGRRIRFRNFPKGDAFVPTLEGSWSYDDLEKVLSDPHRYKND